MTKPVKVSEGVTKKVLKPGQESPCVSQGAVVTVAVTGKLTDKDQLYQGMRARKHFWSTKDYGMRPLTFTAGIGQIVQGLDEGIMTMCLMEKSRIKMDSSKGYGAAGAPMWKIPPNAKLTFETTILKIKEPTP